jgi:cytochrome c553
LGVVPVEADGSVFCEAPVGKPIYFQLLDEKGFAVQSMRSVTYVHPGEQMRCVGCHEDKWKSPSNTARPIALGRAPSKIVQEVKSGAVPFNFLRLVKRPVFDKKCVSCHEKHTPKGKNKKAPDMSYASLARPDLLFTLHGTHFQFRGGDQCLHCLGIGGSRTTPGRFGAQASGFMASLKKDYHKDVKLSADELRRITLWLDLNANEICWISDDAAIVDAQKRGEIVWPPKKFVDPENITAVETALPLHNSTPRD